MCGFVALIEQNKNFSERILSKIDGDLYHRGPDSSGRYVRKGFALVFRRLAILDIRNIADQPMVDDITKISMVFNGEIYNYKKIRKDLESKGHNFQSESDSEVIMKGYKEWGEDIFNILDGMFAIVIVDQIKGLAFAARDRMGIKPLYFYQNKQFIYIGSEIKPLKNLYPVNLDKSSMGEIIFFRFPSGEKTGCANVKKILPGTYLIINLSDSNVRKKTYFSIVDSIKNKRKSENFEEDISSLLEQSIINHTQSDVGFSLQLSGGLDSSLISAILNKNLNQDIDSYSLKIDSQHFDESEYRAVVNKLYPSNHHELKCDSELFANTFEKAIKSLEMPTTHFGCILLYSLCELISKRHKVILTGEGADEIFGGYSKYSEIQKLVYLKRVSNLIPDFLIKNIQKIKFLEYYKNSNPFFNMMTYRKFDILKEIFTDISIDLEYRNNILNKFTNPLDKLTLYDQTIYLESLLLRQDKLSMAHGLEARVPFVDLKLITETNLLPRKIKYNKKLTKIILKKISEKYFPKDFIYRKKNGLLLPISEWLRNEKGFGRYLELFSNNNCKVQDFCDLAKIKKIIKAFKFKGRDDFGPALAHLINIELWLRLFKIN